MSAGVAVWHRMGLRRVGDLVYAQRDDIILVLRAEHYSIIPKRHGPRLDGNGEAADDCAVRTEGRRRPTRDRGQNGIKHPESPIGRDEKGLVGWERISEWRLAYQA